ncbi:hypothetical protein GGR51DRAFT_556672 [Nemania sp. FL0031]|nr:hypothetical protein GGR51DRAFT_556672 [Nemania sp. FL0031]
MAGTDAKLPFSPMVAIAQDRDRRESQSDPIFPMSPRTAALAWYRQIQVLKELAFAVIYFSIIFTSFLYILPIITRALVTVSPTEAIIQARLDRVDPLRVKGFWSDYISLVTAVEDYEDWFVDVDAGTYAIAVLEATIPAVPGPLLAHELEYYFHKSELVEARSKQVCLAKEIWKQFLERREKVVASLVYSAAEGLVYMDGQPITDSEGDEIDLRIIADWAVKGEAAETNPLNEYSAATLARSAKAIIFEILRTFLVLSEGWLEIQGHLNAAMVSEQGCINALLEESGRKEIWEKRLGSALSELIERLSVIERRHRILIRELEWLLDNFPSEDDTTGSKEEAAKQLLKNWAVLLMDVQEGVLFKLRRRETRCQASRLEDTWEEWKRRNCGGTSCYDAPSIVRSVVRYKEVFIEEKRNPVADMARDEMDWAKIVVGDWTPQIWKSIYEDACCKVDSLSYRLQSGGQQKPRIATIGTSIS